MTSIMSIFIKKPGKMYFFGVSILLLDTSLCKFTDDRFIELLIELDGFFIAHQCSTIWFMVTF